MLSELTAQGASLLLTTQYIEEADRLAGTVVIMDHGKVIAGGTPGQLKTRAGGDRLDLQASPGQDLRQLAAVLAPLAAADPAVDETAGRVILPVADGAGILPEVATRLAAAGLHVAALALRRPTLEEAFLSCTGQPAAGPPAEPAQPAHAARSTR